MTFPPIHGCAVCGRVLDWHEGLDEHIHAFQDAKADHLPVPVPIEEIPHQLRPRCDFCSADYVTHTLPARSFDLPVIVGRASEGDWAACDACAALISRNEWNALLRRVKAEMERRDGPMPPVMERSLRTLYRELRKNVTGALRKDDGT